VPMGIVNIDGLGGNDYVTAVSSATPGKGDPGCKATQTLKFGQFKKTASIALPYGTWTIFSGSKSGDTSKNVVGALGIGGVTLPGRGTVNTSALAPLFPNTVTLDPRQVVG